MKSVSKVFLSLVAALGSATDVHAKPTKTRFLGGAPTSGTFKVPVIKSETRGLRGTTPSGTYVTVKSKGSDNPSPDVTAFFHSVAPKTIGGEKKVKKFQNSTIRSLPSGSPVFQNAYRQSSGGSSNSTIGGFPGGFPGGSTNSTTGDFPGDSTNSTTGDFPDDGTNSTTGGFLDDSTNSTTGGFPGGDTNSTTGDFPGGSTNSTTGGNCNVPLSLSLDPDAFSKHENAMYLYDMSKYDPETESFTADPIWSYDIEDIFYGGEYDLEECLEENVCYLFIFYDTYGDGLTDGNGLTLSYDGDIILSIPLYDTGTVDEYVGSYWAVEMGDCSGSGGDDSGQDQGDDDEDDDSEQDDNGQGIGGNCFDTVITLTTDGDADEMALLLYDENDVDANGDITAIVASDFGSLEDNTPYVVEDMCLDNSGCYVLLLLDEGGDGFVFAGGLDLTVDGQTILSIGPGDLGTYDSVLGGMYWSVAFGNCNV